MAWIVLAFFLLLIAPVRAGVILRQGAGEFKGAAGVMIWGVRAQIRFSLGRNGEGALRLAVSAGNSQLSLPRRKRKAGTGIRLLGLMLKSNGKKSALRRAVRVEAMDVRVRLGGGDAAALALGTGLLRSLNGLLPALRVRCVPGLGARTEIAVRCIAEARLGILLTAWLLARKGEK